MGFGRSFKRFTGQLGVAAADLTGSKAIGRGVSQVAGAGLGFAGGGALGGTAGFAGGNAGFSDIQRERTNAEATIADLNQQQAATAEQARLKLIADASVQAQEELARKKTVFGGDVQQQTLERRKLLGI